MEISRLQKLKDKIDLLKSEKAKCVGQKLQLDNQKKELIAKFNELGVTKDTLPLAIKQLEDDIAEAEKNIDLIVNSLYDKK